MQLRGLVKLCFSTKKPFALAFDALTLEEEEGPILSTSRYKGDKIFEPWSARWVNYRKRGTVFILAITV